jgi:glutathione S-transferase
MSQEIVFYHSPMSRGRIVHWMLEEAEAPHRKVVLDFEKGEHKGPAYLAINPMGKVPAIVHGDAIVTECAAICAYLADAFPKNELAPAIDDPARGAYYRWMFFGAGCVEPAMIDKMFGRPPVERKGALGYGSYEDTFAALESALAKGPYLLGDRFTAADVYIGSQLGWGFMMKAIEKRPAFEAYVARLHDRPAFQRASRADDAAVAAKA